MFQKLNKIKRFGAFRSFSGAQLPNFSKFNLLYGWNYSGKTTLSRIFRSIEKSKLHPDYGVGEFSISMINGQTIDQTFSIPVNVRVFNEDFRKENLRWDEEGDINPILVLGAENISLMQELISKKAEADGLKNELLDIGEKKSKLDITVAQSLATHAGRMARELSLRPFDQRHLKRLIEKNHEVPLILLSEVDFNKKKIIAFKTEIRGVLTPIPSVDLTLHNLIDEVYSHCGQKILSANFLERLIQRPDLNAWIEQGMHLHASAETCEFCRNPLPKSRYAELEAHFSKEYQDYKSKLLGLIEEIEKKRITFSRDLFSATAFYPDFWDRWKALSTDLNLNLDRYNGVLDSLINQVRAKLDNPFADQSNQMITFNSDDFFNAINRFNQLIGEHNARTSQFNSERQNEIANLTNHYAAEFLQETDYFENEKMSKSFQEKISDLSSKKSEFDRKIIEIEEKLSDAAKGAEQINVVLKKFFQKDDIRVVVTPEKAFMLMRGSERARNLSEGERTAISFAYFMVKLSESNNQIADTIVYIDDPISSLDSNHLFNIYSYIMAAFYRFDKQGNPKHVLLCKQLFVSTHSSEFFHLINERLEKMKDDFAEVFLVERLNDADGPHSNIKKCSADLRRYRSEYLYLFNRLQEFLEAPKADTGTIFDLGNSLRRFVEGYLHFKYMESANIEGHLSELLSDPIECERARKFMHVYSHTISRGGAMKVADMGEARAIIEAVFKAVEEQDPIHFAALKTAT